MTTKDIEMAGKAAGFLSAWLVLSFIFLVIILFLAKIMIEISPYLADALRLS